MSDLINKRDQVRESPRISVDGLVGETPPVPEGRPVPLSLQRSPDSEVLPLGRVVPLFDDSPPLTDVDIPPTDPGLVFADRDFSQARTNMQAIDALLSLSRWDLSRLDFGFPSEGRNYPSPYTGGSGEPTLDDFLQAPDAIQAAVRRVLPEQFAAVTPLTFSEVTGVPDIAVAVSGPLFDVNGQPVPTAYARGPGAVDAAGDVWYARRDTRQPLTDAERAAGQMQPPGLALGAPEVGNYFWATALHELGHALGLKHAHQGIVGNEEVAPSDRDSLEFTVMTYRSFRNAPTDRYQNEDFGYPQTLMIDDIRALQTMYGANFNTRADDTTYAFDQDTGEVRGLGLGVPGGNSNKLFLTIWDGGGRDTYDFSDYDAGTSLNIDLSPGGFSVTTDAQRAMLGTVTTPEQRDLLGLPIGASVPARGNVFNALQSQGDPRSLIEDAVGGAGNDTIGGNDMFSNELSGGNGDDFIFGRAGRDFLLGGEGNDYLVGGTLVFNEPDGDDDLDGGPGNDGLDGGAGGDNLVGGPGRDAFIFYQGESTGFLGDEVRDFTPGEDLIIVRGVREADVDVVDDNIIDANDGALASIVDGVEFGILINAGVNVVVLGVRSLAVGTDIVFQSIDPPFVSV